MPLCKVDTVEVLMAAGKDTYVLGCGHVPAEHDLLERLWGRRRHDSHLIAHKPLEIVLGSGRHSGKAVRHGAHNGGAAS